MRKTVLCRVGWHTWVNRRNDEGVGYRVCRHCGKDQDPGGRMVRYSG